MDGGIFVEKRTVIFKELNTFRRYLQGEEREPSTIEKYLREVRAFLIDMALIHCTRDGSGSTGYCAGSVALECSMNNCF